MDFIIQVCYFSKFFIRRNSDILGPGDGVTCFYCGNTLTDWSELIDSSNESIVRLEHARFFPCRFVMYTAGGKFVASAGYFHAVSDRGMCHYSHVFQINRFC